MAVINHAKREINAKIVYYGREGAGKRAALQYIYDRIRPALRGKLKTLATGGDSLTFFDFSPFENPQFSGYNIRFHMYSLTGKVTNPAAWKMTLKGVDGLVVVADPAPGMMPATRESISQLREFLAAYGVGMHDIPCVLQLNRAGFGGHASEVPDDVAAALDLPGLPVCLSDTTSGDGVLKALSLLSREVMTRIGKASSLRPADDEAVDPGGGAVAPAERDYGAPISAVPPEISKGGAEPEPATVGVSPVGELCVSLAGEGAVCADGVIRIPLELSIAGGRHRLVLSVSLEQK